MSIIKFQVILISLLYKNSLPFARANLENDSDKIKINKCCEKFEIYQDQLCVIANDTDIGQYVPTFVNNHNNVGYTFLIGNPTCGSNQIWPVFDYHGGSDKLVLLEDGRLRHYTLRLNNATTDHFNITDENESTSRYYDYVQGQYCIDKGILSNGTTKEYIFAKICSPRSSPKWADYDFILRSILKPIFDIISIFIFLIVAIVYFVLPTLRDLIGNIITTISMCLLCNQAANLIKDLQLANLISFMILDTIIYISLLSAFLWLSSFGYYIWKKFRARNVFLRVTDGQKYCWYSSYAWGLTVVLSILALFAHYFLDIKMYKSDENFNVDHENHDMNQNTIGWLGISIFFSPIAMSILIDIFFQLSTIKLIYKRNVYGRIQQKLRSNFIMFIWLFSIMTLNWIFLLLSWCSIKGLVILFILFNTLQAPLIFYICILRQKHVTFLLKKTFCYNEPPAFNDWGDELTHINDNNY
ncbi:probable G-protein coupled receptor Mth-like 5 [Condylostylus longicornis]|uniref:probable G-protein coupled receptor Mth-like 5 n=1 Tax=Condylostylus longicornis TaxID=2530218 RepID=UPI00244DA258|nr:probable G-protein coupled receptor Mth-like 5 [Condylostylus longicornis]